MIRMTKRLLDRQKGSERLTAAAYADRPHGGRSSARLERQVVALEVGGSSPLGHPTGDGRDHRRLALAPLAQWQSNGLLIRRFWVRIPGGALANRLVSGPLRRERRC